MRFSHIAWNPLVAALMLAAPMATACGASAAGAGGGRVTLVAAENVWGSIAAQIAGDRADVVSVISNPDTDPHAYEPTPQDGRSVAQAQYVIVNGAGYDPWAPKLLDANPSSSRTVLTIADLAGRKQGDNPHMWYSPPLVMKVADQVTSDLKRIDPAGATYFDKQARAFKSTALRRYSDLRTSIRQRYGGTLVGATESIFVDLATDLGLNLTTPPDYMRATSEGNDPTTADKSSFDTQIATRQITVLVFNKQNSTPDIRGLVDKAHAQGIPVVAITETLDPATAAFQDWQSSQLSALQQALAEALGR